MEFLYQNLDHLLCVVLLVGRLGDILTTYLITPRLELEANPVARRLRWPFAWAGLLICLIPYWSPTAGVAIAVPSLLVSAQNARHVWHARALGEERVLASAMEAARRSSRWRALASHYVGAAFLVVAGALLLFFYPSGDEWAFYYALGIIIFGIALALHGSFHVLRVFRLAEASAERT